MNLFRFQKEPCEAARYVYWKIPLGKVQNKRFFFCSSDFGHEQKNPLVKTQLNMTTKQKVLFCCHSSLYLPLYPIIDLSDGFFVFKVFDYFAVFLIKISKIFNIM